VESAKLLRATHARPEAERELPSLDNVVRDPVSVATLTPAEIAKLLAEVGAAQSILTAQLLAAPAALPTCDTSAAPDTMLTVAEAAKLIRRDRRWIWRHKKTLPFVKQISGRSLFALCAASKSGSRRAGFVDG